MAVVVRHLTSLVSGGNIVVPTAGISQRGHENQGVHIQHNKCCDLSESQRRRDTEV
jgi:hypothetical protein